LKLRFPAMLMGRWGEITAQDEETSREVGRLRYSSSMGEEHSLHIDWIGVEEDMQGMGIGTEMLSYLHEIARGYATTASIKGEASKAVFSKFGYEWEWLLHNRRPPSKIGAESLIDTGDVPSKIITLDK